MTGLVMIVALLAQPIACPPEVGQIRWDNFSMKFKAAAKWYDVTGSIWDRDRNGRPSSGDLMRIDSATAGRDALEVDEIWIIIRGKLAKTVAKRFKKVGRELATTCESRFEVEGIPRPASKTALAKILRKFGRTASRLTKRERAEILLTQLADERCQQKTHTDEDTLRAYLFDRGMRKYGEVGQGHIKKMAARIAQDYGLKCAYIKIPKLTFE